MRGRVRERGFHHLAVGAGRAAHLPAARSIIDSVRTTMQDTELLLDQVQQELAAHLQVGIESV